MSNKNITAKQEFDLVLKAKKNDNYAIQMILRKYKGLLKNTAYYYYNNIPPSIPLGDLYKSAFDGLVDCIILHFDPAKCKFWYDPKGVERNTISTFFYWRVRGAVTHFINSKINKYEYLIQITPNDENVEKYKEEDLLSVIFDNKINEIISKKDIQFEAHRKYHQHIPSPTEVFDLLNDPSDREIQKVFIRECFESGILTKQQQRAIKKVFYEGKKRIQAANEMEVTSSDITQLIGKVKRDENGEIIESTAALKRIFNCVLNKIEKHQKGDN